MLTSSLASGPLRMERSTYSQLGLAAVLLATLGFSSCSTGSDDAAASFGQKQQALTGSQSVVVLRCRYPNSSIDRINNDDYLTEYAAAAAVWSDASYGQLDISSPDMFPSCSTPGCSRYYTLPHPRSSYFANGTGAKELVNDCMALADADVDFSQYFGVIVYPNESVDQNLGGDAWEIQPSRDGRATMPGAYLPTPEAAFIAHELGHAFGLDHILPYPPTDPQAMSWDILASGGLANTGEWLHPMVDHLPRSASKPRRWQLPHPVYLEQPMLGLWR